MEVFDHDDFSEYRSIQIRRSDAKFGYCKVSFSHAFTYKRILRRLGVEGVSRILCLGTRNGREIDVFRLTFFFPKLARLAQLFEVRVRGWNSLLPWVEAFRRNRFNGKFATGAYGVEINPSAARQDVHIGSFDDLPGFMDSQFDVIYSNSFDQSIDPVRTARAWMGCLRPGGLAIIAYGNSPPTKSDPVGNLEFEDLVSMFSGKVLFAYRNHLNYSSLIVQKI